jgi:Mg-chelatase subunit ChlD
MQHRRGVVVLLAALMMPIVCGFAALAIDAGYAWTQRSMLQNTADASALAGASALPDDIGVSRTRARDYIARNPALAGPIERWEIDPGRWERGRFVPTTERPNALRVVVMRNEELFFAPVLGINNASIRAVAIATHGGGAPRNIMLVLDVSGSMRKEGKWESAKSASLTFVDMIADTGNGSLVGAVLFDDDVKMRESLTDDFDRAKAWIEEGRLGSGTNIAGGLAAGWQESVNPATMNRRAKPVVILLSDGKANRTGDLSAACLGLAPEPAVLCEAQQAAHADQPVTVHTISLGRNSDPQLMERAATITGGKHYHAPTGSQLEDIYAAIAQDGPLHLVQ